MTKTPEERLVAQADAIRDLRKRVAALEEACAGLLSGSGAPVLGDSTEGRLVPSTEWVPRANCLACGKMKGPGRETTLTCKPCGQLRNDVIYHKGDRSTITTASCGACGGPKPANTHILCGTCGAAYKSFQKRGANS